MISARLEKIPLTNLEFPETPINGRWQDPSYFLSVFPGCKFRTKRVVGNVSPNKINVNDMRTRMIQPLGIPEIHTPSGPNRDNRVSLITIMGEIKYLQDLTCHSTYQWNDDSLPRDPSDIRSCQYKILVMVQSNWAKIVPKRFPHFFLCRCHSSLPERRK